MSNDTENTSTSAVQESNTGSNSDVNNVQVHSLSAGGDTSVSGVADTTTTTIGQCGNATCQTQCFFKYKDLNAACLSLQRFPKDVFPLEKLEHWAVYKKRLYIQLENELIFRKCKVNLHVLHKILKNQLNVELPNDINQMLYSLLVATIQSCKNEEDKAYMMTLISQSNHASGIQLLKSIESYVIERRREFTHNYHNTIENMQLDVLNGNIPSFFQKLNLYGQLYHGTQFSTNDMIQENLCHKVFDQMLVNSPGGIVDTMASMFTNRFATSGMKLANLQTFLTTELYNLRRRHKTSAVGLGMLAQPSPQPSPQPAWQPGNNHGNKPKPTKWCSYHKSKSHSDKECHKQKEIRETKQAARKQKEKDQKEKESKKDPKANLAVPKSLPLALVATESTSVHQHVLLDSGSTLHLVSNKNRLINYVGYKETKLLHTASTPTHIMGYGSLLLPCKAIVGNKEQEIQY